MRRALLVTNPEATSVSPRVRDVIAHALETELKLDRVETKRRHHATHLAAGAAHEGYDLVVCLAGDGTLNEIVNGLAGTDIPVAPLPGGGTSVFARAMGMPKDPIEATSLLIEHLHEGVEPRRVSLGRVNGRAFSFCAGVGFDAAIVRAVERRFRLKQRIGEPLFVMLGVTTFFTRYKRRDRPIVLDPDGEGAELSTVIACNLDPYTYLGTRPFRVCPGATPEGGLDATSLYKLRTVGILRVIASAFGRANHVRWRGVHAVHDSDGFTLECTRPVPLQVDGDYAGEGTRFVFENVPDALSVIT